MDRVKIGNTFRVIRVELCLRQTDVAERAGVAQQTVSDLECGRFGTLSVDTYCQIAAALDADIPLAPHWRGPRLDRIRDQRHAVLQNRMVSMLAGMGWQVGTERSFNRYGDRGSVDVLGWRPESRTLLIVEIKSQITSLEETLRTLDVKWRVVPTVARTEWGLDAIQVATVLAMPDASTHRDLVRRHAALVSGALPGHGWDVRHWLAAPAGDLRGVMFLRDTDGGGAMRNVTPSRRVRRARLRGPEPVGHPNHAPNGRSSPASASGAGPNRSSEAPRPSSPRAGST